MRKTLVGTHARWELFLPRSLGGFRKRSPPAGFGWQLRSRAHRRHGLRLRAGFRRGESEGGLFPAPKTLVAAPTLR
jgi:hypothetical protein